MKNENFACFIKWYFNFTSEKFFIKPVIGSYITKKERIFLIPTAYLLLISSGFIFFLDENYKYFLFCILIYFSFSSLHSAKFSLIFYFVLYLKSKKKYDSINDRILIEEGMIYKTYQKFRNVINQYYKIIRVKGTMFSLKYVLVLRETINYNKTNNKKTILKITSNKIFLNRKKISNKKITTLLELNNLLQSQLK